MENNQETISADVPFKKFEAMAKAEDLTLYLGRSKVKITDKDKNAIKDMFKFINDIE